MRYPRAVTVLTVAGVLLAGCNSGGAPSAPVTDERVCRSLGTPAMTGQRSVEDCLRLVKDLNTALSRVLPPMLPAGATITNNMHDQNAGLLGGAGVSFMRTRSQSGGERYLAAMRIGDRAAWFVAPGGVQFELIIDVELEPYDAVPGDFCTKADTYAKGIGQKIGTVNVECRESTGDAGTIHRLLQTQGYGTGDYGKLMLPTEVVYLYRPGGELVTVRLTLVVDKSPRPPLPGTLPTYLSLDQLATIASTPDLTAK